MMHFSALLTWLCSMLLLPDILAALLLLLWVLWELGRIAAESLLRYQAAQKLQPLIFGMQHESSQQRQRSVMAYLVLSPLPPGLVFALAQYGPRAFLPAVRRLCLEQAGLDAERRTARLTLCVRLGPMVGLVGTLIPLGPGLVALGQGNLAVMAAHLAVAFNVTVVGLCTGALGFLLAGVQRRRDGHDLATLAFIADTLEGLEAPKEQSVAAAKPEET